MLVFWKDWNGQVEIQEGPVLTKRGGTFGKRLEKILPLHSGLLIPKHPNSNKAVRTLKDYAGRSRPNYEARGLCDS